MDFRSLLLIIHAVVHIRGANLQTRPLGFKVVIAGLCRNAAKYLPHLIGQLEDLACHFDEVHVVVSENDSDDDTRSVLQSLSQRRSVCPELSRTCTSDTSASNCDVVSPADPRQAFSSMTLLHPPVVEGHRVDRILHYRRGLRGYLTERFLASHNNSHVLVWLDFDIYGLDVASIVSQFASGNVWAWQVLCSHSLDHVGWYRDVFATVFDTGAWAFPQKLRKRPRHAGFISQPKSEIRRIGGASQILPMQSCFGGLALYNLGVFMDLSCDYADTEQAIVDPELQAYVAHDDVLCEHVPFHFCLSKNMSARIGLVPEMRIFYEAPVKGPVPQLAWPSAIFPQLTNIGR